MLEPGAAMAVEVVEEVAMDSVEVGQVLARKSLLHTLEYIHDLVAADYEVQGWPMSSK